MTPEATVDERVVTLLVDIQTRVGALQGDVGQLRGELSGRPCVAHAQEIQRLHMRVSAVDRRVDAIHAEDLPEIRQSIAGLDWWRSGRNKVIAAVLVALLGVAGAVAGDLLLDAVRAGGVRTETPQTPRLPAARTAELSALNGR